MNISSHRRLYLVVILYVLLVGAYFASHAIEGISHAVLLATKTLPVALLGFATLRYHSTRFPFITIALFFSAAGDLAGECGVFFVQLSLFAIAHVMYACGFLHRVQFNVARILLSATTIIVAIILGYHIIPHIGSTALRTACSVYIVLIALMAISAIIHDGRLLWLRCLSAWIFILSDAVLAWNRFVENIPHAGAIIMGTYFTAQLGLTVWAIMYANREEV